MSVQLLVKRQRVRKQYRHWELWILVSSLQIYTVNYDTWQNILTWFSSNLTAVPLTILLKNTYACMLKWRCFKLNFLTLCIRWKKQYSCLCESIECHWKYQEKKKRSLFKPEYFKRKRERKNENHNPLCSMQSIDTEKGTECWWLHLCPRSSSLFHDYLCLQNPSP